MEMNYSYRIVQTYVSDNAPWFYEGQYGSLRPGDVQWTDSHPQSGNFSIPPQHRVQFPFIVIEAVAKNSNEPYELGNLALWVHKDIILNIASETKVMRNRIIDIWTLEEDHTIKLFDTEKIMAADIAPLDFRGMLINRDSMYPNLVDNHTFTKCAFRDVTVAEVESLNPYLHEAKVRITCQMIIAKL